jgi:hypothetical protein
MSYLGLSEDHWMFVDTCGNVYGVCLDRAITRGDAWEIAFTHFYA